MDSDLKESNELVQRLAVPESTKNFVFAIKVPEHDSTIYLLSVHNLSQRSATDAECLIRELRPDAVVTQVNPSAFGAAEEEIVLEDGSTGSIPTSVFEVVTRCVFDKKISKKKYKRVAGNLVMEEIFGTGFNKHLLTVEKVAVEVGSTYVVLDSPFVMKHLTKTLTGKAYHGSALINDHQQALLMQRLLLSSQLSKGIKKSNRAPKFARSTYNLLVHIHNTLFDDLPAIRKALKSATKILHNVYKGESIDREALTEAYIFRDAVESLRTASNNAGRIPIKNLGTAEVQFSNLSFTDKSYALMADELRSQGKKFKTIVGVVDTDNLAGLRRQWRTRVPQEVKHMSTEHTVQGFDSAAGALTLSKAIFASPMFKISTIKTPLIPFLTHKAMPFAYTKVAYPSTVMGLTAQCFASYGAQPMYWEKHLLSPSKIIRALTKFGLSSAQRTSFSAMRGAFFTMMMRKRLAKPIGTLPRVVFGASLVIWWGSHVYGKGIEHAALTLPSAPSIAKLGRGIQNLREASLEVTKRGNNRVQNTREGLTQRLSKNWALNINFKTSFGS